MDGRGAIIRGMPAPSAFHLGRLRPLVRLGAALAAAWAVTTGLAVVTIHRYQAEIGTAQFRDGAMLDTHAGRVAALVRAHETGADVIVDRLAVVWGSSAVLFGVDAHILTARDPVGLRWVNHAYAGARANLFEYYARPLEVSGLEPKVNLVGVYPMLLARSPHLALDPEPDENRLVARLERRWLGLRRRTARRWVLDGGRAARSYAWHAMGGRLTDFTAPRAAGPWAVRTELFDWLGEITPPDHASRDFRYERQGLFDPGRFSPGDAAEAEALLSFVEHARRRGTVVVIVLMPQRTTMRARTPPEAYSYLAGVLEQMDAGVPIIDLVTALNDAEFSDAVHPTTKGRIRLSHLIADHIGPIIQAAAGGTGPQPE